MSQLNIVPWVAFHYAASNLIISVIARYYHALQLCVSYLSLTPPHTELSSLTAGIEPYLPLCPQY